MPDEPAVPRPGYAGDAPPDRCRVGASTNVELVDRALRAINDADIEAFLALCDARFEMDLLGTVGEPVRYEGAVGVREFFTDMGESWSSFGFDVDQMRDLGDQVLVVGRQRGRGRASGIEVASPRALVAELRGGALARLRYFLEPHEALAAVGLQE